MIHRNICPICGSENPEGAEFCQVCKANLMVLPDDMFPTDPLPVNPPQTAVPDNKTSEKNSPAPANPIPDWLVSRFQQKDKQEQAAFDFDSYTNALFGMTGSRDKATPSKTTNRQKPGKPDSVYQPLLENIVEPPLIEPDENSPKTITENIPGIADFSIQRPARKWEDRLPENGRTGRRKSSSIDLLHDFTAERPARKWDDQNAGDEFTIQYDDDGMLRLPSWWQEDAPLVETDTTEAEEKTSEAETAALVNSVSPTKVMDAEVHFSAGSGSISEPALSGSVQTLTDEYEPEGGSLLSDLMNEMNSASGSLTPSERQENENGTVFYSGNQPVDENIPESKPETEFIEIDTSEEGNGANAAMLDRILRGIGYQVEGEPQPGSRSEEQTGDKNTGKDETEVKEENTPASDAAKSSEKPEQQIYKPLLIENPLVIPENDDDLEDDTDSDDINAEEKIPSKDDDSSDLDIPWDLFGAADMSLPQSPEDPAYRTFSRSGLPEESDATAYQQRMISSILGKIIHAENFVEPVQEKNERAISLGARLFWTMLALCGIVLILLTPIVDHLIPESLTENERSRTFYQAVEETEGNALVVMDYSPAYSALMDTAAESLLAALEGHTAKLYLAVMNPSAMPFTQQILNQNEGKTEFAGWWPSGLISIRTRIAFKNLPEQIWLLTSEANSVQNWAEQLAVSNGKYKLHVMTPGQLSPVLKSYLDAGMITSALCSDADLLHYGENEFSGNRNMMAVWYLAALVPLAWLFGALMKFFKTKPNYERIINAKSEETAEDTEKETVNG